MQNPESESRGPSVLKNMGVMTEVTDHLRYISGIFVARGHLMEQVRVKSFLFLLWLLWLFRCLRKNTPVNWRTLYLFQCLFIYLSQKSGQFLGCTPVSLAAGRHSLYYPANLYSEKQVIFPPLLNQIETNNKWMENKVVFAIQLQSLKLDRA